MCSCEQNSVKGCQNLVTTTMATSKHNTSLSQNVVVKLCGFYAIMNERRTAELRLPSHSPHHWHLASAGVAVRSHFVGVSHD